MEKKFKSIVLALAVLLVVGVFIIFKLQNSRLSLIKLVSEYSSNQERIVKENQDISNRLNKVIIEKGRIEKELDYVKQELERISKANYELEQKYELTNKQKLELEDKLSSKTAQVGGYQAGPVSIPDKEEAYWAGLLKSKTDLELQVEDLTRQLQEKEGLAAKFDNLSKQKQELEERLLHNQRLFDKLSAELVKLKLHGQGPDSVSYIEDIFEELEKSSTAAVAASGDTATVLGESVKLPTIVVSPPPGSDVSKLTRITGKILTVNARHNFVVINLGLASGVIEGMIFEVLREGWVLGQIKVVQARRNIAACDIVEAKTVLKAGDEIRL